MVDKTILVVEDNKDDEVLLLRALNKNDVNNEVIICRDGAEAIDCLFNENNRKKCRPDLIILDLNIPKICGLEVLKKIKTEESTKKIPVVVLTTSVEKKDISESYRLNANSFIKKPIDFLEFTNVVKVMSSYWLKLNQNIPRD